MKTKGSPVQSSERGKQAAGIAAANLIQDDMLVGLGTGSTALHFIQQLGQRCKAGLKITCVATSTRSWQLGIDSGLKMVDMKGITTLDIIVDGADEIAPNKDMIKGGGGALLREKILASISKEMVVVIDSTKVVDKLGKHPLPVEIVAFAFDATVAQIHSLDLKPKERLNNTKQLFLTDGGNHIVDIDISSSKWTPHEIDQKLRLIPGLVETGFFFGLAGRVIIGFDDGSVEVKE